MVKIGSKFLCYGFCSILSYPYMFSIGYEVYKGLGVLMNITCREVSYKYTIRLRLPQGISSYVCVYENDKG